MKPITAAQIKKLAICDTASLKDGVYTVRRGFFYTHGRTAETFAEAIKAELEVGGMLKVTVIDKGEVWKPFRGGASTAANSHWWVKFTLEQL